jgi:hypothetical protein
MAFGEMEGARHLDIGELCYIVEAMLKLRKPIHETRPMTSLE